MVNERDESTLVPLSLYIRFILLKHGWLLFWGPGTRDTRCSVNKLEEKVYKFPNKNNNK